VKSQEPIKQRFLSSTDELSAIICNKEPLLFLGSCTSTVIPYDCLDKLTESNVTLVNSSKLKPYYRMESDLLRLGGSSTWKDAKSFCQSRGRTVMTSPTEELAQVLSGVATSCTGERCFGLGTLRDQIHELKYMNHLGQSEILRADRPLCDHHLFKDTDKATTDLLKRYQQSYKQFKNYKNAPFPRFEQEIDLMVGTEGQLGIVTEGLFETQLSEAVIFLFFSLPKWEQNYNPHLQIYEKVQNYRGTILSCEFIDENSWSYLDSNDIPIGGRDTIFLEIKESELERIYEDLIIPLNEIGIKEEDIFSMSAARCHELRMKIPRAIFERNSHAGVVKKGTDVQATGENFVRLLDLYRELAVQGIRYNLFGHFGDAHLHFNFMPRENQVDECAIILDKFYRESLKFQCSPFAEHGIGLLKQKFIWPFLSAVHYEMFSYLKKKMDPDGIFFPGGYMNIRPLEIK